MIGAIHAIVLTYNRQQILLDNVAALLAQTHALASIIVVDNGSTDGTQEALRAHGLLDNPLIDYRRIEPNIGAARGFNAAIEYAYREKGVPWGWLMDDDVMPAPGALAELVRAYEDNFTSPEELGFLVAQAVDAQGRANNVPAIDNRPPRAGECAGWGRWLDKAMVSVRTSAFVGFLMPQTTYRDFGNLNPAFVVWGEDSDFTLRITEQRPGLLVGKSKVVHLRAASGDIVVFTETNPARVPNFYYLYRNTLYIRRRFWGFHTFLSLLARGLFEAAQCVRRGKFIHARYVLAGLAAGLVFKPVVKSKRRSESVGWVMTGRPV